MVKSLAHIEAQIDFAEDDLPDNVLKKVNESIKEVYHDIKKILDDHKTGEKIRNGFRVSIIGAVNAGKSSLLNLLSKRDLAIVSEEEGTTRDVIEAYLNIDGYPVILADTAGIRDSKNDIEKKGILLALNRSKEADLNLIVIDSSSKQVDTKIKKLINDKCIVVLNKSDITDLQSHNFEDAVLVSVKENINIDKLIRKIKEKLSTKTVTSNNVLVTRERHREKLNLCLKEIDNFLNKDQHKDIEIAAEDLRLAINDFLGVKFPDDLLGEIFKDFCIGK